MQVRGEGVTKSRGRRPSPSFPPSPSGAALLGQTPKREAGPADPLSVVLAGSPVVGGVWMQRCFEIAAPVWVPRRAGGQTKKSASRFLSPVWPGAAVSDTPDPLDSGGSPSLCWITDMKARRCSHPGGPALVQLGQVVHVGGLLDDQVHLRENSSL